MYAHGWYLVSGRQATKGCMTRRALRPSIPSRLITPSPLPAVSFLPSRLSLGCGGGGGEKTPPYNNTVNGSGEHLHGELHGPPFHAVPAREPADVVPRPRLLRLARRRRVRPGAILRVLAAARAVPGRVPRTVAWGPRGRHGAGVFGGERHAVVRAAIRRRRRRREGKGGWER